MGSLPHKEMANTPITPFSGSAPGERGHFVVEVEQVVVDLGLLVNTAALGHKQRRGRSVEKVIYKGEYQSAISTCGKVTCLCLNIKFWNFIA